MWEKFKKEFAEDILYKLRKNNENADYNESVFNEALIMLEEKCMKISMKSLEQLGLPSPNRSIQQNKDSNDTEDLEVYVQKRKKLLNSEQELVFTTILN